MDDVLGLSIPSIFVTTGRDSIFESWVKNLTGDDNVPRFGWQYSINGIHKRNPASNLRVSKSVGLSCSIIGAYK